MSAKLADPAPSPRAITAWARLIRVSQRLLERVEARLKAAGLPPLCWYDVLLELHRAESGELRPYEIEERVLLAQYNVSRLIDRLEDAGCVTRRTCTTDARGRWVGITAEGRELLRRMWPVYRACIAEDFADRLDDREADRLAALLGKLSEPTEP